MKDDGRQAADPALFRAEAVSRETSAFNAELLARLSAKPDAWQFPVVDIRRSRAAGQGSFPLCPPDPHAVDMAIEGPGGPVGLRVMHPRSKKARGVYLHFHGGGWIMGEARENDDRLRRLVEETGLSSISVDYRLAPEAPYPAAPDDCETAALWLIGEGGGDFNRDVLAIGGESAGAHLALVTLLRLRDRHHSAPFAAANLVAGCYDLALTPSVRSWGTDKLIINTRDVEMFVQHFLPHAVDRGDPDASPLHADLTGLPPMLLSCGTADLLIDDTLFLAQRLAAAGVAVETAIHPGGCHVFQAFPTRQAEASLAEMSDFLNARIAAASPA